jgi:hypothetical protein
MLKLEIRPVIRGLSALSSEILADRDELHLRRDDSLSRVVQLGHRAAIDSATGPASNAREGLESILTGALIRMLLAEESVVFRLDVSARVVFRVTASENPRLAERR